MNKIIIDGKIYTLVKMFSSTTIECMGIIYQKWYLIDSKNIDYLDWIPVEKSKKMYNYFNQGV